MSTLMSRGLGRWQISLLAALEEHPAVYLADLLPPNYPRAQYVALHRAAQTLWSMGRVDIWHTGQAGGTNSMWVTRPGHTGRPASEEQREAPWLKAIRANRQVRAQ
jgi:hypothetical protein